MKVKRHVSRLPAFGEKVVQRNSLGQTAKVGGTHVKTFVDERQGSDDRGPVAVGSSHLRGEQVQQWIGDTRSDVAATRVAGIRDLSWKKVSRRNSRSGALYSDH